MGRLETLRRAGRVRFSELGFPKTRQEAWRFTNLGAIERTLFLPASAASAGAAADPTRLFLVLMAVGGRLRLVARPARSICGMIFCAPARRIPATARNYVDKTGCASG